MLDNTIRREEPLNLDAISLTKAPQKDLRVPASSEFLEKLRTSDLPADIITGIETEPFNVIAQIVGCDSLPKLDVSKSQVNQIIELACQSATEQYPQLADINLSLFRDSWRFLLDCPLNRIVSMNMCSENAKMATWYRAKNDHRYLQYEDLYYQGTNVRFSERNDVGAVLEIAAWERHPSTLGKSLVTRT